MNIAAVEATALDGEQERRPFRLQRRDAGGDVVGVVRPADPVGAVQPDSGSRPVFLELVAVLVRRLARARGAAGADAEHLAVGVEFVRGEQLPVPLRERGGVEERGRDGGGREADGATEERVLAFPLRRAAVHPDGGGAVARALGAGGAAAAARGRGQPHRRGAPGAPQPSGEARRGGPLRRRRGAGGGRADRPPYHTVHRRGGERRAGVRAVLLPARGGPRLPQQRRGGEGRVGAQLHLPSALRPLQGLLKTKPCPLPARRRPAQPRLPHRRGSRWPGGPHESRKIPGIPALQHALRPGKEEARPW
eukprot:gene1427-biopygen2229